MLSVFTVFGHFPLEITEMDFEACSVLMKFSGLLRTSDDSGGSCFKEGPVVSLTVAVSG